MCISGHMSQNFAHEHGTTHCTVKDLLDLLRDLKQGLNLPLRFLLFDKVLVLDLGISVEFLLELDGVQSCLRDASFNSEGLASLPVLL